MTPPTPAKNIYERFNSFVDWKEMARLRTVAFSNLDDTERRVLALRHYSYGVLGTCIGLEVPWHSTDCSFERGLTLACIARLEPPPIAADLILVGRSQRLPRHDTLNPRGLTLRNVTIFYGNLIDDRDDEIPDDFVSHLDTSDIRTLGNPKRKRP